MTPTGDPLAALRADHEAVRGALEALGRWLAQPPAPLPAALARFLERDLERHLAQEEDALFPALERYLGREGGPVYVMLLEHRELRRLAPALAQAAAAGRPREAAAAGEELLALLGEHVHKEDAVLFPLAERLLAPAELEEVRRRLEEAGG